MKTKQFSSNSRSEIINYINEYNLTDESLVFVFSDKQFLDLEISTVLSKIFKSTPIIACSTAGEIVGSSVYDGYFSLTTVSFDHTQIRLESININHIEESFDIGQKLVNSLIQDDLKHIFILSDGLNVNGTNLVDGINSVTNGKISVSGGLAGDNALFNSTLVSNQNVEFKENTISAVGFYGDKIKIQCSSESGWEIFGKDRIITKSNENIVYEIDHKPALELYKSYLGDKAKYLPSSGRFLPLSLRTQEGHAIRTILSVNKEENSIRFAGNIPVNSSVKLMKTNIDSIIDAAEIASLKLSKKNSENNGLMIMISCVGRKLVLKQIIQEEVEAVTKYFNDDFCFSGFYSYGELSSGKSKNCSLHNQTMTLTLITEN